MNVRAWYVIGMAVCAAAAGDPLVESCANRSLLGGRYADNDHSSVIPALIAGIALALFVSARLAFSCTRSAAVPRTNGRDAVAIVALQFIALYAMERAEAFGSGVQLDGGFAWLGGPPAASLALHLLVGLAVAAIGARFVHALADAVHAIVRVTIALAVVLTRARTATFRHRRAGLALIRPRLVAARALRGRAPPFPALL
jgi:hypothetical protein